MFPPKSPLDSMLGTNDKIDVYGKKGQMRISKYMGNKFMIELNGRYILVLGEQLFDCITDTFKSLSPTTENEV